MNMHASIFSRFIAAACTIMLTADVSFGQAMQPGKSTTRRDEVPGLRGRDGRVQNISPKKQSIIETLAPTKQQMLGPVVIDEELIALTEQLESGSFEEREAAQARLAERLDWRQADEMLGTMDLTEEQRVRLIDALRENLMTKPRGALGVSMDLREIRWAGMNEVRVKDLVPGMPAATVLRVGDRITRIDDRRIRTRYDLVRYVQYRSPGEEIVVHVRRPILQPDEGLIDDVADQDEIAFEPLELVVTLGSVDNLGRTGESPVLAERRHQSSVLAQRHAVRPKRVPIESSLADDFVYEPNRALSTAEIDRATEIRLLREQLDLIASGEMELTPQLVNRWQSTLDLLERTASDPTVGANQREYVKRIAERFAELIAP